MTQAESMAALVCRARYEDLSCSAREQLKIRVLDALGCAIGALVSGVARTLRVQTEEFGGAQLCSAIGGALTALVDAFLSQRRVFVEVVDDFSFERPEVVDVSLNGCGRQARSD